MKAITAISAVAQFVNGDIKGGKEAHVYRMAVIGKAITQALQGNWQPIAEAQRFATGDSIKARCYAAAFVAAGVVQDVDAATGDDVLRKVAYAGKLSDPVNAEAQRLIRDRAALFTEAFSATFLSTEQDIKAQRKAEKEAAKGEPAGDGADSPNESTTTPQATPVAAPVKLGVTESVQTVLAAIKAGAVADDDIAALYEALTAHYAVVALAAAEAVAA